EPTSRGCRMLYGKVLMCRRIEPARSRAGTHTIEHAVHAIERVPTLDGFDRLFAHFGQPHASPRHFPPPPRRSGLEGATPIPARNTSRLGRSLSQHGRLGEACFARAPR